MLSSNTFKVWHVMAAAAVALCVGLLAGNQVVVAQEPIIAVAPPIAEEVPVEPIIAVAPPIAEEVPVEPIIAVAPPIAEEVPVEPIIAVAPPAVVDTRPPRPTDAELYQQYLLRLFQLKADMATLSARIGIYTAVSMAEPDPFIQYELDIMWFQLGMMQMELTEVRFVLTTLNP